jgi:hypothetical protein
MCTEPQETNLKMEVGMFWIIIGCVFSVAFIVFLSWAVVSVVYACRFVEDLAKWYSNFGFFTTKA